MSKSAREAVPITQDALSPEPARPRLATVDLSNDVLPLSSERLFLRALNQNDAPRIALLADEVRIAHNLGPGFPSPYRLADAEAFLADPHGLGIELRDTGELIGVIGPGPQPEFAGVLTLGYWLGVDYWGQGLASEALELLTNELRRQGTYRRLEASVYSWNPASARVLEKAGYQLEGRRVQRVQVGEQIGDELLFGLVLQAQPAT